MAAPTPVRALRTADVARVLGLSEARVRAFVRAGWCAPGRQGRAFAFGFQDLVVLRVAKSLHEAQVPPARVKRALRALARELGAERALSGLRITADGARVVVHAGGARFEPESGQLLLDFSVDALADAVARREADPREAIGDARGESAEPPPGRAQARRAFAEALAMEDTHPAAAMRAYRRALARDPSFSDAAVNLARLVHEAGRAREAVELYQAALAHAPDDAELHYNLALALEDANGSDPAIHHYEHALALDPSFADAHWNLAGLLEAMGRKQEALRHYREYEKLSR
jgi:hypothetical protein